MNIQIYKNRGKFFRKFLFGKGLENCTPKFIASLWQREVGGNVNIVADTAQKKSSPTNCSFWSADEGTRPPSEAQVKRGFLWKLNIFYPRNPITNKPPSHKKTNRPIGFGFWVAEREFTLAQTQKKRTTVKPLLVLNKKGDCLTTVARADEGTRTPTPLGIRS